MKLNANEMIERLLKHGVSKYKIARVLKVSWNTVHLWHKEVYKPDETNLVNLKALVDLIEQHEKKRKENLKNVA